MLCVGQLDSSVYFFDGVEEEYILNIQEKIREHEKVLPDTVSYVTEEKVEEEFAQENPDLTQATVEALDGTNPLGAKINFEVISHSVEDYEIVEQYIKELDKEASNISGISTEDESASNNIQLINNMANQANLYGIIFIVVFIIFVFFVTYNTIRLSIYTASDEIHIMKLVGASNWFVRGPFVLAGLFYGVFSSIVVMAILFGATAWLGDNAQIFHFDEIRLYSYVVENVFNIYGILLATGVGLGVVSSYIAVRRYLRV